MMTVFGTLQLTSFHTILLNTKMGILLMKNKYTKLTGISIVFDKLSM